MIYEKSAETKFKSVGESGGAAGVTASGLERWPSPCMFRAVMTKA